MTKLQLTLLIILGMALAGFLRHGQAQDAIPKVNNKASEVLPIDANSDGTIDASDVLVLMKQANTYYDENILPLLKKAGIDIDEKTGKIMGTSDEIRNLDDLVKSRLSGAERRTLAAAVNQHQILQGKVEATFRHVIPNLDKIRQLHESVEKLKQLREQTVATTNTVFQSQSHNHLQLGFDDKCVPVVFMTFVPNMTVKIADVTYRRGRLDVSGYSLEIRYPSQGPIIVNVKAGQPCNAYVATIDGRTISSPTKEEWDKTPISFSLAFPPNEPGDVLRRTEGPRIEKKQCVKFSYTSDGKRQLIQLELEHDGKRYTIAFSGHTWDEDRKYLPTGYTAQVLDVRPVESGGKQ